MKQRSKDLLAKSADLNLKCNTCSPLRSADAIALKTYRQLQPEDCMTLASLHQQGLGVRAIAHVLQRSPATVSRELQRNTDSSGYASIGARDWRSGHAFVRSPPPRRQGPRIAPGPPSSIPRCGDVWAGSWNSWEASIKE